jgi:hypothetical protein
MNLRVSQETRKLLTPKKLFNYFNTSNFCQVSYVTYLIWRSVNKHFKGHGVKFLEFKTAMVNVKIVVI